LHFMYSMNSIATRRKQQSNVRRYWQQYLFNKQVIYTQIDTVFVYAISSPECKSKSGHKTSKQIVWKCVTVQIFGDYCNKPKFDSGGN
jgi:hypothetical protein